ncbi:hypothetical protein RJT34_22607 [Clitoria ternatea]|uniref:Uncharacterized protein n=1 Tax=Clitoria ternatea TaxID=43366 RepID=A0AAN9FJF5_CLITE
MKFPRTLLQVILDKLKSPNQEANLDDSKKTSDKEMQKITSGEGSCSTKKKGSTVKKTEKGSSVVSEGSDN